MTIKKTVSKPILREIKNRLSFLHNVGLGYLTLDRNASTLSGGESQRIRLATQIGSALYGVTYVLDEPSIGLHQRDNDQLIKTMKHLRDLDNTVVVVEHDEETMMEADWLIEIGPGAGLHGGYLVDADKPSEFIKKDNKTALYLSGRECIPLKDKYRNDNGTKIRIKNASGNNLKNVSIDIPLGIFVGITGVSGSGKSTLINETLVKYLTSVFFRSKGEPAKYEEIVLVDEKNKEIKFKSKEAKDILDKAIPINQDPIGRTPRSNPATYIGVFDHIRKLFASTVDAKMRGYNAGRFSFNTKGGRCEACSGCGTKKIEMHFLPDIYVNCDICNGTRYNRETLDIRYRGKTIADVLEMTAEESLEFFASIPSIKRILKTLVDVGLGYVKLGQQANTLSGGEAQRVKLASELSRPSTSKTIYILDEPTNGLHFDDVKRLLYVLERLIENGNTVLVIEHNLDVVKSCDWIIDMGPEGGSGGGEVMCIGTPDEIIKDKKSYTGIWLKKKMDNDRKITKNK